MFRDRFQVKAHQRAAAARQRQGVVTAHHAIATFCENFIIHRAIRNMRFTTFTNVFRHAQQQIAGGYIRVVDKGQVRRNLLQFGIRAKDGSGDKRIRRADIGMHKRIGQGSVQVTPETFYSAIDFILC